MLTIKKKRPEAEVTGAEAATMAAAPAVSDAPPGLEPVAAAPVGGASASSFKVFAILGMVVTLCVIAVIALQYMQYAFFGADPSVWLAK